MHTTLLVVKNENLNGVFIRHGHSTKANVDNFIAEYKFINYDDVIVKDITNKDMGVVFLDSKVIIDNDPVKLGSFIMNMSEIFDTEVFDAFEYSMNKVVFDGK